MMTNDDAFTPKNADIFFCKKCDFKCYKNSDWKRHTSTPKHKNDDKMMTLLRRITPK